MDELEALRQEYAQDLPRRLSEIEALFTSVRAGNPSPESLEQLQNQVHKLAGSGAVYGFDTLSEVARELDTLLLARERKGIPLEGEALNRAKDLMAQLRQASQS